MSKTTTDSYLESHFDDHYLSPKETYPSCKLHICSCAGAVGVRETWTAQIRNDTHQPVVHRDAPAGLLVSVTTHRHHHVFSVYSSYNRKHKMVLHMFHFKIFIIFGKVQLLLEHLHVINELSCNDFSTTICLHLQGRSNIFHLWSSLLPLALLNYHRGRRTGICKYNQTNIERQMI